MDAHRIDVLDEADRNDIVVLVADDLKLQLFPAHHGLFDQDLVHQRCLEASRADGLQLFFVINQSAAGAAHGVRGAQDHRISKAVRDLQRVIHAVGDFTAGHLDPEALHGLLELDAVLTALDRIDLNADDLHVVLVQDARLIQLRA